MKRNPTLKWLTISLLLGISVFCYTVYAKITLPIAPNINANTGETPVIKPTPKPEKPTEQPTTVYNSFPRKASVINGVTVQNIGGMGREILRAVHNLGNNSYVIFDTASNSYDIKSDFKTIAVALLDNELTIQKILVLPAAANETFGASKITSDGILITAHSADYTRLYKINYNLTVSNQIQLETSNNSYMYFTEGGTYLFMSQADKLTAKLITRNFEIAHTSSTALDNPEIIEIFPSEYGFNIYVNGDGYYGYASYNTSSGFKSNHLIYGYTVKQIFPTAEKGNLVFGVLLYGENEYKIVKMDKELNETASHNLGEAEICFMYPLGENFWVYIYKTEAKTILFCTHLDKVFECPTELDITALKTFDCNYPTLQFFAFNRNHELLILSTTGGEPKISASYQAEQSYVDIDSNGTIYFTSASKQDYFAKNYGNYDIYIIKNSGE